MLTFSLLIIFKIQLSFYLNDLKSLNIKIMKNQINFKDFNSQLKLNLIFYLIHPSN